MKAMADVCVSPIGVGVSVSRYVVECQKIFQSMDLDINMHAYGTNIEGEWDEVMEAIKRCHETLHEMGAPRIGTTIRLGTRNDRQQSIKDKIESVRTKLGK
ncbi:MAG: MTH1187 family thiamine-binding protein [Gammaproteobacteria bacterium]|nr:MTH1187 family thiamine-binding protein [Gammaproteobacteria bacterium]